MSAGPSTSGQPEEKLSLPVHPEKVSSETIRTQLDRILASPGFVHSDRMARFLRFAVEQTIQGQADSLKESVLGIEVFDRTASFDPRTDTIVRVEARRLRSKLKEYYETHGQRDEVLIDFPKGSYVPIFLKSNGVDIGKLPAHRQVSLRDEAGIPTAATTSTNATRLPAFGIALALAVLLGAGGATLWWRLRPAPAPVEWKLRPLTADDGLTTTPTLSPDGKLAAYASDRTSNGTNLDLWVQPLAKGSQPLQLTKNPADDMSPTFSPDGSQIAFYSSRDGGGIYLISTFGGEERLLVRGGPQPNFSPDGRWVAYTVGYGFLAESKVFIVPAGGGVPKRIAIDIPWASDAVWSPDGRHRQGWSPCFVSSGCQCLLWLGSGMPCSLEEVSRSGRSGSRMVLRSLARSENLLPAQHRWEMFGERL